MGCFEEKLLILLLSRILREGKIEIIEYLLCVILLYFKKLWFDYVYFFFRVLWG